MTITEIENAMWDRHNWHEATEEMAKKHLQAHRPVMLCSGGFLSGEIHCHEGPQAESVHAAFVQIGRRWFARYVTGRQFSALTSPKNIHRLRAELAASRSLAV